MGPASQEDPANVKQYAGALHEALQAERQGPRAPMIGGTYEDDSAPLIAQLATQLLAAQITKTGLITDLIKRDAGSLTDEIHTNKLKPFLAVARAIVDLAKDT